MTESKTTPSVTDAEATLENEALAEVHGGVARTLIPLPAIDLAKLRERLNIGGLANYHIKDSGPSWVNSPRSFDFGQIVLPVLPVRPVQF